MNFRSQHVPGLRGFAPGPAGGTEPPQPPTLTRAWLQLGLLALLLSSVCSIILISFRSPLLAGWWQGSSWFRVALVLHVDLAAVVWFLAVAGALWGWISQGRGLRTSWLAWGGAVAGVVLMVVSPFFGGEQPVMSNYLPVLDHPIFLLGLSLFGAGVGVTLLITLLFRGVGPGCLGEVGIRAAAATAALALLEMARVAWILPRDGEATVFFEAVFWGGGHLLQLTHTLLMTVAWLWLAEATGWQAKAGQQRWIRWIYGLGWLPATLMPAGMLLGAPIGYEYREFYSQWMAYASWPVAVAIGLVIQTGDWREADRQGAERAPLTMARRLSMVLFGLGLLTGTLISHDNLVVTAHYHGTVGAVTLAYMGLAQLLSRRLDLGDGGMKAGYLTMAQPWMYGMGMLTMMAGLLWSGWFGVPRKSALVEYPLATWREAGGMWLMGVGGVLALFATLLFLVIAWRGVRGSGGDHPPRRGLGQSTSRGPGTESPNTPNVK